MDCLLGSSRCLPLEVTSPCSGKSALPSIHDIPHDMPRTHQGNMKHVSEASFGVPGSNPNQLVRIARSDSRSSLARSVDAAHSGHGHTQRSERRSMSLPKPGVLKHAMYSRATTSACTGNMRTTRSPFQSKKSMEVYN